jgi:hypothetical protein
MTVPSRSEDADRAEHEDQAERRQYKRVFVEIPGAVFVPTSRREATCKITNISPSGAEIVCAIERLLDTQIVLYAAGLGRFDGHVIWNREGRYGVRFSNSEFKQARLADELARRDSVGTEARNETRTKTNSLAKFTREDGSVVPCAILDFSTSGVLVQSKVRPQIGEYVLMGGMVGRVVRYDATGIGIEFIDRERDDTKLKSSLESLDEWRVG